MLIVLSPAKTLDYESKLLTKKRSQPRMLDESEALVEVLAKKSAKKVGALMGISDKLAELNHDRFQIWSKEMDTKAARPAVLAFKGDVYLGLDVSEFSERDFTQAQKHLRILSGLHGLLRPLDLMRPYRLEMGTRLKTKRGKNLYEFWGERITDVLKEDMAESKSKLLINLASNEYFSAIKTKHLDTRVISPAFLDEKNGHYKMISFFAKKARGAMASYLIRERVKTEKGLLAFEGLDYSFDEARSTPEKPVFVRPASKQPIPLAVQRKLAREKAKRKQTN